jgi:hypothetical protein
VSPGCLQAVVISLKRDQVRTVDTNVSQNRFRVRLWTCLRFISVVCELARLFSFSVFSFHSLRIPNGIRNLPNSYSCRALNSPTGSGVGDAVVYAKLAIYPRIIPRQNGVLKCTCDVGVLLRPASEWIGMEWNGCISASSFSFSSYDPNVSLGPVVRINHPFWTS